MHRNLDCDIDEDLKKTGYYYNCSTIPLFDLGSLHHDYYLVNLRIPGAVDFDGHSLIDNDKLGKLIDLWMIAIHQNGGFTKVWLGLKTFFFPAIVLELWWMHRRFVVYIFFKEKSTYAILNYLWKNSSNQRITHFA